MSRTWRSWSWRVASKGLADVVGKLVTLGVMVLAARALAPEAFGVLAVASTAGWLLGVATDAGLSMHLAREVARRPDGWVAIAFDVVSRRLIAAGVAMGIAALAGPWIVPAPYVPAFALLVAGQLAGAVLETVMHLFRGLERTDLEAALHGSQRASAGVLAAVVLLRQPDLHALGLALLLPPVCAVALAALVARRLVPLQPDAAVTPLTWRDLWTRVLPLGAGALLSALYFRCDVFFVEYWHGLEAAGAYNAVFRLVEGVRLLPAAVLAASFPQLVRATDRAVVARLGAWLGGVGTLCAVGIAAAAPWIVALAYGAGYADASGVLRLLAASVPLFFLNYALTHQVIGWGGQRAYLGAAAAALVVNVAADLALVPQYGARGAAIATCFTEVAVTAACVTALRRHGPPALAISAGCAPS